MNKYDIIYHVCKLFFSMYWLVYILSLVKGWNTTVVFHVTGIMSIVYLIVNVRWWLVGSK